MNCFIHDLSLNGQYSSPSEFLKEIEGLLQLRQQYPVVQENLYCTRSISQRPVTATQNLRDVARGANVNMRQQILNWISKKGPFWDEDRSSHPDDYFECSGQDVTDQGAGEAARRKTNLLDSSTFSFSGSGFDYSPLLIQHGLLESPIAHYYLSNYWQLQQLQSALHNSIPKPSNWTQTILQAKQRYPTLIFPDYLLETLQRETFTAYLAERIFELLGILHEFIEARHIDGGYSSRNDEIIANHFAGGKAWFTDESETNKRQFKERLTFADPLNLNTNLFCPWHGKIKTPQFRIHLHPWPLAPQDKKIKIVYIGPKLTKD